jgi:hypothetical protein
MSGADRPFGPSRPSRSAGDQVTALTVAMLTALRKILQDACMNLAKQYGL